MRCGYQVYQDAVGVIRRGCGLCRGLCNARVLGLVRNLFEREFLGHKSIQHQLFESLARARAGEPSAFCNRRLDRMRERHELGVFQSQITFGIEWTHLPRISARTLLTAWYILHRNGMQPRGVVWGRLAKHFARRGRPPGIFPVVVLGVGSSARNRNDSGTVRPRALAVVKLMTSSNLVGCSTARAPGFFPLR